MNEFNEKNTELENSENTQPQDNNFEIENNEPAVNETSNNMPENGENAQETPKRKKPIAAIIIAIAVVLVILGGLAYLFFCTDYLKPKDKKTDAPVTSSTTVKPKSNYEKANDAISATLNSESISLSLTLKTTNQELKEQLQLGEESEFTLGELLMADSKFKLTSELLGSGSMYMTSDEAGNIFLSYLEDGEASTVKFELGETFNLDAIKAISAKKLVDEFFDGLESELAKEDVVIEEVYNSKTLRAAVLTLLDNDSLENYCKVKAEDGKYTITVDLEKELRYIVDTLKPAFTEKAITELTESMEMTLDEMIDTVIAEIEEIIPDKSFEIIVMTENEKATEVAISIPSLETSVVLSFNNIDNTKVVIPKKVKNSYDDAEVYTKDDILSALNGTGKVTEEAPDKD